MKIMYTEIQMTDEQLQKLRAYELETGEDGEKLVERLFLNFIDSVNKATADNS